MARCKSCLVGAAVLVLTAGVATTLGVTWSPDKYGAPFHGEVNVSGATLFEDFFGKPASTNDYIDPEPDSQAGKYSSWPPDQLATTYAPGLNTFWLVNYRGQGSINGLAEFFDYQACGVVATSAPKTGWINRVQYSTSGNGTSPEPQSDITMAVLDVPVGWATVSGPAVDAAWDKTPAADGYGQNPNVSSTGFAYVLEGFSRDCDGDTVDDVFFNVNNNPPSTPAPDAWTLYDTQVAWVPISFIANRRSGVENMAVSDLQHMYISGRTSSGENLVAATRTPFSGTRNGAMNSIGVDPSWGMGDNIGSQVDTADQFQLDPSTQQNNCKGSGNIETVIQNWSLSVGYTGLAGSSRSAKDAKGGKYEIIDVIFDDRGGSTPVRPSIDTVLDNADPDTGYQVGGPETFVTLGDPEQTNAADVTYMANQAGADYLKNIIDSISNFSAVPADPDNDGMPGEFMATTYFLMASVDALPDAFDPNNFVPQATPPFNQALQDYIRANNDLDAGGDVDPYGSANYAGLVPARNLNPDLDEDGNADTYDYTDGAGSSAGTVSYCYCNGGGSATISTGDLGSRNDLAGDFNFDGVRDTGDIANMVEAYFDPRGWSLACTAGPIGEKGDQIVNTVITEVIGDFNGDGDFSKEDLRYFMDGLSMVGGQLNRKAGAIAIDNAIIAEMGASYLPWADTDARILVSPATHCDNPTFDVPSPAVSTMLSTGAAYASGDFRGDIAGSIPVPGAAPVGWDGQIDADDVQYVYDNFGTWSDKDDAVEIDLSADMDGDLDVDIDDVEELIKVILKACDADGNLDGVVDASDDPQVLSAGGANGEAGTWLTGDYDLDGDVDADDVAIWSAPAGPSIIAAESVMSHGTAGDLGVDVLASGAYEGRQPGPTKLVVTFDGNVTVVGGTAAVSVSSGTVTSVTAAGAVVTVELSGVANAALFTASFGGIQSACGGSADVVSFEVKVGNTDANLSVNIFDLLSVRNQLAKPVTTANVRSDVQANGVINIFDLLAVRNNLD